MKTTEPRLFRHASYSRLMSGSMLETAAGFSATICGEAAVVGEAGDDTGTEAVVAGPGSDEAAD